MSSTENVSTYQITYSGSDGSSPGIDGPFDVPLCNGRWKLFSHRRINSQRQLN